MVAHDRNRRSGGLVVIRGKQAPAQRFHAKRREIVARDVLRAQRLGGESAALPPHAQARPSRLKCSHFFEFRRLCFQPLVERKGEHSPPVLRAAFHAAIVAVADTVQKRRIRNRQRPQHDRVDHREDCSGSPNSQRQRQCRGRRKYRRHPKLPQGIPKSAAQVLHPGLYPGTKFDDCVFPKNTGFSSKAAANRQHSPYRNTLAGRKGYKDRVVGSRLYFGLHLGGFARNWEPRLAGSKTAPGRRMRLAGTKDGGLAYTERELEVQNGNSGNKCLLERILEELK